MARKKRIYDDDDGRTIADMSGVERPNLLGFHLPSSQKESRAVPEQEGTDRPWEKTEFSPSERRAVMWGAIGAAALIALTFILCAAAVILLITRFA